MTCALSSYRRSEPRAFAVVGCDSHSADRQLNEYQAMSKSIDVVGVGAVASPVPVEPIAVILLAKELGPDLGRAPGPASKTEIKDRLNLTLRSLTGNKIQSIERLPYFLQRGGRFEALDKQLNKEVRAASGGRIQWWKDLLSDEGKRVLAKRAAALGSPVSPTSKVRVPVEQVKPNPGPPRLNLLDRDLGLSFGPAQGAEALVTGLSKNVGSLFGGVLGLPPDTPQQALINRNRGTAAWTALTQAGVSVSPDGRFALPNTRQGGRFLASLVAEVGQAGDLTGSGLANVTRVGSRLTGPGGLAQRYGLSKEFVQGYQQAQQALAGSTAVGVAQSLTSLTTTQKGGTQTNRPKRVLDQVAGARTQLNPNDRPIVVNPASSPVIKATSVPKTVPERLTLNVEFNGDKPPPKLPPGSGKSRTNLPDPNTIAIKPTSSEVVKPVLSLRSQEMNNAIPNALSTPINRLAVSPQLPGQKKLRGNGNPPPPSDGVNNRLARDNTKTPRSNQTQLSVPVPGSGNRTPTNTPVIGGKPQGPNKPLEQPAPWGSVPRTSTTFVAPPPVSVAVPIEVFPPGSPLPGLGKESALRNVTPPNGNGAGAVELGVEVQVLRGFSIGADLSTLIGALTGQSPNLRTRLGPVELLGGGYGTATLELGNLERGLPGGNPQQADPKSTRIKRSALGAADQPPGKLWPDDPNGPSARWKAFAIATGPTWPGRDGNDAQYTWRLGLGDVHGNEYGPTNVLVDYGMARNNVQRVDFDLHGERGALATGAVKNTGDPRLPLQLNVVDIGGGNVKFAGPVPLPVRVQSVTSLPAALLKNLPAAGAEVWEWTGPARSWLQGLGLDGLPAGQLIEALRQQPWVAAVGGGAEGLASRLPNVKAKFSANVSIAPGQVLPRGLVEELNRQLNPQTPVFKQAGSIADGYRLQVRTDLPPGVRGFDFPVSGVRDFMHALIPPSKWGSLTTKLEFEFPLRIPLVGVVPIVTVTAKPDKLKGAAGAWRTAGETISKLNPSGRYMRDALGSTPLAAVDLPLSNLLLRHPDGTSLSVAAVRETPPDPWGTGNPSMRIEVASFVPKGDKPPGPDTPAYLLFTANKSITIVPHSVVHALDGNLPLTAAMVRSLQQQAKVWDQPEQASIRIAYLRFTANLREGQKLDNAQVQKLVEFVKLGLGRRPKWPSDPAASPNPQEVPNVTQRVQPPPTAEPPTIDVDDLR